MASSTTAETPLPGPNDIREEELVTEDKAKQEERDKEREKEMLHTHGNSIHRSGSRPQLDLSGAAIQGNFEERDPTILLPNQSDDISHLALDIGGSLIKLVYFSRHEDKPVEDQRKRSIKLRFGISNGNRISFPILGGRLHFVKFETTKVDECLEFIKSKKLHCGGMNPRRWPSNRVTEDNVVVKATGGGAFKYAELFKERLGVSIDKEDEMSCLVSGANFLLKAIRHEAFTHIEGQKEFVQIDHNELFPYLLVNIGSGVSVIKVDGDGQFQRVSGTNVGGGTYWGLGKLLTKCQSFDELLELSQRGDNRTIDMLVGDIYGGMDYSKIGLSASTIASSFGKTISDNKELNDYRPEDISLSLLRMISYNIGQIAYLNALRFGLKRIFFGGFFIRGHAYTMDTITFAVHFWSKGDAQAMFLRHEGFLGALGAFMSYEKHGLDDVMVHQLVERFPMGAPYTGGKIHGPPLGNLNEKISWMEKFVRKGTEITAPVPMTQPGTTGLGGFDVPSSRGFFASFCGPLAAMESSFTSLLSHFRSSANSFLSQYEPLIIAIFPLLSLLIARILHSFFELVRDQGLKATLLASFMHLIKLVPGVKRYIDAEKQKVVDQMQSSNKSKRDGWRTELPKDGLGNAVIDMMKEEKKNDAAWQGKCSGTVYIGGSESEGHFSLINEACSMFAHTNPLHLDVFQSVVRFEAEVVAMTAALFGSKEKASGGQICGNMTSGGTESILLAVKSSRDYMKAKRGITTPEMIIAESAHSAYDKAAQYFNIKLRRVPVNKAFQADTKAIRRWINKNTVLIVGSSPGYPHGIIDPIEELAALASSFGVCLHVDLCLGGFVLPFARKLGYPVPPFDFCVQGVTSMSVDVHKYGLAPKGTSVVLYRNHEIRKHQFVAVTEWTGGLYVSPTIAGSRPGSLIAGAWAAMISVGEEGYLVHTRQIMETSKKIQQGIKGIQELYIIGKPDMTIVAFGSEVVDIFEVNDILTSKGWHLNALQRPNSLHICVTLQHVNMADEFVKDLKESVQTVKANPGPMKGGMAPIYGAAGRMPDRVMVGDLLVNYMDSTC